MVEREKTDAQSIVEGALGVHLGELDMKQREVAMKVASWCLSNFKEDGKFTSSKLATKTLRALDESLFEIYGEGVDFFMSRARYVYFSDVKKYIWKILRKFTAHSLTSMGMMFGYDHSTVLHNLQKFTALYESDRKFREGYDILEEKVKLKINGYE